MRITNKTLTSSYLRNLNNNLAQVHKYHNQLSSGKEVSKPSDNPMLVSKIMSLKDNISANEQYNKNISDTKGWVQTQDTALADVTKSLNRIRNLMIYGANGSMSETDRLATKNEVEQEMGQLVDVLNTNFDGRYIFAGQETLTRPFELVDALDEDGNPTGNKTILYHGDISNISREISTGVSIDMVTNGGEIVGELYSVAPPIDPPMDKTGAPNELGIFLNEVLAAFDNDPESLSGELLDKMDINQDRILRTRTKIGAIDNRLQAAEARNKEENINLKGLLSNREDIDIAEKYMEFSIMAVVYQASLSTGAKILQPSLLDYIR